MANNRGSNGRFLPGNKSGGRPKLPPDALELRRMEFEQFIRYAVEVRNLTIKDMKDKRKLNIDKIPLGKRYIINAYAANDHSAIKIIEDRLFGKAQESINLDLGGLMKVRYYWEDPDEKPKKKRARKKNNIKQNTEPESC